MLLRKISLLILFASLSTVSYSQVAEKSVENSAAEKFAAVEAPPGFKSDGCTWFPDGKYRDCCEAHDLDYYRGGTEKERRESDKRLYRCVKAKGDWRSKYRAPLMYLGVRVFGVGFLPTPFRWGFGRKKIKKAEEAAKAADGNQSSAPPQNGEN